MTEQRTWKPIETAPKNTSLLLWVGWAFTLGHFNTHIGAWVENWDHRRINPVKWMPLPDPPTEEIANG